MHCQRFLRPRFFCDSLKIVFAFQTAIYAQAKQLAEQKALIDGLRKLLCASNPAADVCKQ